MVMCCVPSCCTNSRKCDPAISFHKLPTELDMIAKWIRNINSVVKSGGTWYPRNEDMFICSKHFLPTDFKTSSEISTLKPHSVPTLFANILGFSSACMNLPAKRKTCTHSPLIVKVNKNDKDVFADHIVDSMSDEGESSLRSECGQSISEIPAPVVKAKSTTDQPVLKKMTDFSDNRKLAALNKRRKSDLELIEIGPNTFLKINPKVIKVAKKITSSGNSVLQFIMKGSTKSVPEILTIDSENSDMKGAVTGDTTSIGEVHLCNVESTSDRNSGSNRSLDNIIGHLVGRSFTKEISSVESSRNTTNVTEIVITSESGARSSDVEETNYTRKTPVLGTAGLPLNRFITPSQRLALRIKQKNRELRSLRKKLSKVQSRLESMENKCIVQERELSYVKIKKMKAIQKAAVKGDPTAVYLLEQIKAFNGNPVMRWSDSTLRQCSIWCRKAPYAYEYFKKADFFKLPCLSTVKRFMKKFPPEQSIYYGKESQQNDDSSSDFNFDSSDDDDENNGKGENLAESIEAAVGTNSVPVDHSDNVAVSGLPQSSIGNSNDSSIVEKDKSSTQTEPNDSAVTSTTSDNVNNDDLSCDRKVQATETVKDVQEACASGLNIQEVVLPQGLVHCLNSKLDGGQPQYVIIPALNDQTVISDHQYSVLQASSGPLIIQNVQSNQLPSASQEQLIFITHSSSENSEKAV